MEYDRTMVITQLRSEQRLWWELLSSAEGIGLVSLDDSTEIGPELIHEVLRLLDEAGVARRLTVRLRGVDPMQVERTEEVLRAVLDALRGSPLPQFEWATLTRVLGSDELATLLHISESSLHRYAKGRRSTPDVTAERLHFLALIVGDLLGAYNEVGVRRWFHRPRTALQGKAPIELLGDRWTPEDQGPKAVSELARSLLFSSAT